MNRSYPYENKLKLARSWKDRCKFEVFWDAVSHPNGERKTRGLTASPVGMAVRISSLRFLESEKWHNRMEENLIGSQQLHMQFALWPVIPCRELSLQRMCQIHEKMYIFTYVLLRAYIKAQDCYQKTVCMRNRHMESWELQGRICLNRYFQSMWPFLCVPLTRVTWQCTSVLCCPAWRPLATCGSWNSNYIQWQVQTLGHTSHISSAP